MPWTCQGHTTAPSYKSKSPMGHGGLGFTTLERLQAFYEAGGSRSSAYISPCFAEQCFNRKSLRPLGRIWLGNAPDLLGKQDSTGAQHHLLVPVVGLPPRSAYSLDYYRLVQPAPRSACPSLNRFPPRQGSWTLPTWPALRQRCRYMAT